mmetsp:Transcript_16468/g.28234  ORF Transcript_16468/g.28234 Transcript_16468/m.28234 type:complete len:380 (+) Transcript_16468:2-1141(+)
MAVLRYWVAAFLALTVALTFVAYHPSMLMRQTLTTTYRSVVTRASSGKAVQAPVKMSTPATAAQVKDRAKAAVLGGLAADAASMGLHWIYKPEVMAAALDKVPGSADAPEFYSPPACPFYSVPAGDYSPYGYEGHALLKYIAGLDSSTLDGDACAKSLAESYAATRGYLNHSSKHVMEAVAAGTKYPGTGHPTDAQANAFVKAPMVVALLAGRPTLMAQMETAVRVQQNNEAALAAGLAGAALLEKVVLGHSVAEAVAWAMSADSGMSEAMKKQLEAALELKGLPFSEAVAKLGSSCSLPMSLQNSVLAGVKFSSYVEGVRANILAGGDNASRAVLLGALLAAQEGMAAIPAKWRTSTTGFAEAEALVDKILAARDAAL